MTLPIAIPSTPAGASPASDDSSTQPRTPVSPNVQSASLSNGNNSNNGNNDGTANNNKRKPSRRANTAERRATHNAVERQRRETLNGRFLDLAALLPNLSQIRRPSKSSIVNSSIAHIHASRRHRLLASRELRVLKHESDALRRELNEWRDRAGIPRVEEPVRGEGFSMILSGELEVLPMIGIGSMGEMEDEDGDDGEGMIGDDVYAPRLEDVAMTTVINANVPAMGHQIMQQPQPHPQAQASHPNNMNVMRTPHPPTHPHAQGNIQERMDRLERLDRLDRLERLDRLDRERLADRSGAMIASPTAMSFNSPAVPGMYESQIPSVANMNTMGSMGVNMGMTYGMQVPNGYSGGFDEHGNKFNNPDQAYLASLGRSRSGSLSSGGPLGMKGRRGSMSSQGSSSGSASPPMSYSPDSHGHGGEWGYNQMGVNGGISGQMARQGMMVNGGMGGMGGAGVAFAMMM